MLEFFGIKLTDKTGNVARAVNWQERFQHLNEYVKPPIARVGG